MMLGQSLEPIDVRSFLCLRFVSALSLLLSSASGAVSAQEVVADYSWAREDYGECADLLLGSHEDSIDNPVPVEGRKGRSNQCAIQRGRRLAPATS